MALLGPYFPPSRENWESLLLVWQFFPAVTAIQWLTDFYPQGKTAIHSRFNLPGKLAWATMESAGFITVLYLMYTLPAQNGIDRLPGPNWLMASLFSIHYVYRALISPILNPSMSPIHPIVWLLALSFQIVNGTCIGGWLAGYGPTTTLDWAGYAPFITFGMVIFFFGLMGNMYHDDELREIRRASARTQKKRDEVKGEKSKETGKGAEKVYQIPENGLFRAVLYPHYFCEWAEWCGFWVIGGLGCVPARAFVINEIATMLPRALQGKRWYLERFGEGKVAGRKAVIPGVI